LVRSNLSPSSTAAVAPIRSIAVAPIRSPYSCVVYPATRGEVSVIRPIMPADRFIHD
jgi:hypothetical protein